MYEVPISLLTRCVPYFQRYFLAMSAEMGGMKEEYEKKQKIGENERKGEEQI